MARNGSGTFSLADTVTNATTVDADELNAIFTDLGDELTNSVAVDGQSTMTAPLKVANGSAAAPSVTFGSDTDTGIYRISANTFGITVGGTLVATLDTNGLTLAAGRTLGSSADIVVTANITDNAVTLAKIATQADGTILSNVSGGDAVPAANTINSVLTDLLGSTQGTIIYHNGTAWTALPVGTDDYALTTNGAAADPSWQSIPALALPSQSGNSGKVLTTNGSTASWSALGVSAYGTGTSLETTPAIDTGGYNFGTPTVPSTGVVRFPFSSALSNATYTAVAQFVDATGATHFVSNITRTTGYVEFKVANGSGTLDTPPGLSVIVFGGQ